MGIRLPRIIEGAEFNPKTTSSTGGTLYAPDLITAKAAEIVVSSQASPAVNPSAGEFFTLIADYSASPVTASQRYQFYDAGTIPTFEANKSPNYSQYDEVIYNGKAWYANVDSPIGAPGDAGTGFSPDVVDQWNPRMIAIGASLTETLENLATSIKENDSTIVTAWVDDVGDAHIKRKEAGAGFSIEIDGSSPTTLVVSALAGTEDTSSPAVTSRSIGNNGALALNNTTISLTLSAPKWSDRVTYTTNDLVLHNGTLYRSILASNLGLEPDSSSPDGWAVYPIDGSPAISGLIEISLTNNFTETDDISNVVTTLDGILVSSFTPSAANYLDFSAVGNRLAVSMVSQALGTNFTLTVNSGSDVFVEGECVEGKTQYHPAADEATDCWISLYGPGEPYDFRYDNRPIIDLAQNDKDLYRDLVALRDGWDIDSGAEILSSDDRIRFKGSAGVIFEQGITVYGDIVQRGGQVVTQNEVLLNVTDRFITLNDGETGAGVTEGEAGLIIDRGTENDSSLKWDETSGGWLLNPSILGGDLHSKGTFTEAEQVSIGDGTNSQGTYTVGVNAPSFLSALSSALSDLPNGGRIFIKRGSYDFTGLIAIADDILLEGEGAATVINNTGTLAVSGDNWTITNMKFITTPAVTSIDLISAPAQRCIVEKVFFEETASGGTDITFDQADGHVVSNCISTTSTTNLP